MMAETPDVEANDCQMFTWQPTRIAIEYHGKPISDQRFAADVRCARCGRTRAEHFPELARISVERVVNPETPDFTQIARHTLGDAVVVGRTTDALAIVDAIAEQLRLAWNARGVADAEAVERRIRELVAGEIVGAGIGRHVADAIEKLDR